tara:strand:- start:62246 stop:62761 length:516 start_codon:yes stop_codon:yes gene_type:complete
MNFDLARVLSSDSFTSFWYWIIFAVTWSRITHFSLGVGLHDVRDALRNDGQDMLDVETLIEINARKLTQTLDQYGVWLTALLMFFMATLATLGFGFDFELAQAMTLMLTGFITAFALTARFAYRVRNDGMVGTVLCKGFTRLRTFKQFVGILMIFITSFYSAYYVFITRGL